MNDEGCLFEMGAQKQKISHKKYLYIYVGKKKSTQLRYDGVTFEVVIYVFLI